MTTKILAFYDFIGMVAASRVRARGYSRGAAEATYSRPPDTRHIPHLRTPPRMPMADRSDDRRHYCLLDRFVRKWPRSIVEPVSSGETMCPQLRRMNTTLATRHGLRPSRSWAARKKRAG